MDIQQTIKEAIKQLNENEIKDSRNIAITLMQYLLQCSRQQVLFKEEELRKEKEEQYQKMIQKIIEGTPLQYITNYQEFMKLPFYVNEHVLIPQPDTEVLVEEVIKRVGKEEGLTILDIGTGSGAIAISLATYLKSQLEMIIGSDISEDALQVAKENARKNNVEIDFIKSDMWENIPKVLFDVIVSNPPYIASKVIPTLEVQVQKEPILALSGGKDGLLFYKRILKEAFLYMRPNGYLCLEIGYDQKESVIEIAKQQKQYDQIEAIQDLSGNDRCIIMKRR